MSEYITSYIDRLFIIANNNKQTENYFFQDVIHINIYFQRENLLPLLRQRLKSVHIS